MLLARSYCSSSITIKARSWRGKKYPDEWAKGLDAAICFGDIPPVITKHFLGTRPDGTDIIWERKSDDEPAPISEYYLMIPEMDALVRVIVEKVRFNPAAFPWNAEARELLLRMNDSPLKLQ